jgi:nitrogen fixation/metabolism regulation signal transduction histidine kinase
MELVRSVLSRFARTRQKEGHDIIVVLGIFVISAILVLGLFPREGNEGRLMYLYTMMSVPIIIGIYFIITSFRRSVVRDSGERESTIRAKIMIIFALVSALPVVPVVIISNAMMNRLVDQITSIDPAAALSRAADMTRDDLVADADSMRIDCEGLIYQLNNGILSSGNFAGRQHITRLMGAKGYVFQCFIQGPSDGLGTKLEQLPGDSGSTMYSAGIRSFVSMWAGAKVTISRVTVGGAPLFTGIVPYGGHLLVLYQVIPEDRTSRLKSFEETVSLYNRKIASRPFMRSVTGLLMLILAIGVVVVSIFFSIYLSRSITKPVLDLEKAARDVASGDLSVSLRRDSGDEFGTLFQSFNAMVRQLRENRDAIYVAQKLNAWREVSRKLLHEIKNPLTPIKLSAERIRLRYAENHPDISSIVEKGTGTIIEEVGAIQHILDEFTSFARLPEIEPEVQDLNEAVKDYVGFFHGHENISFTLTLQDGLPFVRFDRLLLRQAVINIIKNAIEAMDDAGAVVITTGVSQPRTVFVTIKDSGPGIAPSELPRLFDPTFSKKRRGTGLGLSIVEKIALDHRGRVYCTSVPGEGAAFTIELPAVQEE